MLRISSRVDTEYSHFVFSHFANLYLSIQPQVKNGDTVYFNGGSLMWKSTLMEAAERGCCGFIDTADIDDGDVMSDISSNKPDIASANKPLWGSKGSYSFQPYAYPRASLSDWERVICKATLECYQRHFNLKVGVYVQGTVVGMRFS